MPAACSTRLPQSAAATAATPLQKPSAAAAQASTAVTLPSNLDLYSQAQPASKLALFKLRCSLPISGPSQKIKTLQQGAIFGTGMQHQLPDNGPIMTELLSLKTGKPLAWAETALLEAVSLSDDKEDTDEDDK